MERLVRDIYDTGTAALSGKAQKLHNTYREFQKEAEPHELTFLDRSTHPRGNAQPGSAELWRHRELWYT